MKIQKILVSTTPMMLSNGALAVAVYPAGKGEDKSYILTDSGKKTHLKGSRIDGVGVTRYLKERGYVPAAQDNPKARMLADLMDIADATKMVEEASREQARYIQKKHAEQSMVWVPFDPKKAIANVKMPEYDGFSTTTFNLLAGLSIGTVKLESSENYNPELGWSLQLNEGWLLEPHHDVNQMPVAPNMAA